VALATETLSFNPQSNNSASESRFETNFLSERGKLVLVPYHSLLIAVQHARKKVLAVKADMELGTKLDSKPTIFRTLLTPDETQGGAVPTAEQIADEALAVLAAAADTTGNSMTVATYNVVSSPLIYEKLTSELKTAFPDPQARLSFAELEKLPYLVSLANIHNT